MTRKLGWALRAVVAAGVAASLHAEPAGAQAFPGGDTNVVGSALALPVDISENGRVTEIVVTNAGPAIFLHVTLIDQFWNAQDFTCFVTANETTLFEFRRNAANDPTLSYECTTNYLSQPPVPSVTFTEVPVEIERGIMFVSVENGPGFTATANQLFGDATVIDFDQGTAYSFEAISFRSIQNDFNREYRFDDFEYTRFPARLAANFIAPTPPSGADDLVAELVLFTLDGTIDSGFPHNAQVSVIFYNDDEVRFSAGYAFDCFSIVRLTDIDPRFFAASLGSVAGHLVLTPQVVSYGDLAHDFLFGNGNGVRRTPVHGWLVETGTMGTQIGGGPLWLSGNVAWGRPLARSITNLVPEGIDVPTLNAQCAAAPCP
jgi:hypothetical protein